MGHFFFGFGQPTNISFGRLLWQRRLVDVDNDAGKLYTDLTKQLATTWSLSGRTPERVTPM